MTSCRDAPQSRGERVAGTRDVPPRLVAPICPTSTCDDCETALFDDRCRGAASRLGNKAGRSRFSSRIPVARVARIRGTSSTSGVAGVGSMCGHAQVTDSRPGHQTPPRPTSRRVAPDSLARTLQLLTPTTDVSAGCEPLRIWAARLRCLATGDNSKAGAGFRRSRIGLPATRHPQAEFIGREDITSLKRPIMLRHLAF